LSETALSRRVPAHDFMKGRFIISPETDTYEDQFPVSGRAQITPFLGKQEERSVKKETYLHLSFFLQLLHGK